MDLFVSESLSLLRYLPIFLMSGFKFMVGVGMSVLMGLSFWEQLAVTTSGGVTGVIVFTYLGDTIRTWIARWRRRPPPSFPSQRWARLWEKYGLWGIALLTPPILSPPIGTAIALAFGTPRNLITLRMTISMVLWGLFFAGAGDGLHRLW